MSLRDKAKEIKAAAEAERGNFQPTGAPLRLYNYWLKNTESKKGWDIRNGYRKENFCHFWRVVAFWAPFMWLRQKAASIVFTKTFGIIFALVLALAIVALGVTVQEFGYAILTAIGLTIVCGVVLASALAVVSLVNYDNDEDRNFANLPSAKTSKKLMLIPTAWLFYGIAKFVNWKHAGKIMKVTLILAAVSLAVFMTVAVDWWILPMFFGVLLGILTISILGGFALEYLGNVIATKRRESKNRDEVSNFDGEFSEDESRSPSKVSKFFSGLGDFFIFISQIIRVKKWKVCPIVEVKND